MLPFVLVSLAGLAPARASGVVLDGHNRIVGEQAFLIKRHLGGPSFPDVPVFLKGHHGPVAHGPPLPIKGAGPPPFLQPQPIFLRETGGHKGGFIGHAPPTEEAPLIIKGNFAGFAGHAPLLQAPPIVFKHDHAAQVPGHPITHGPSSVIIRGDSGFGNGFGRGVPIIKDGGHIPQAPPIFLKAGHGSGVKAAVGLGHEQHAVSGPSYLITTVHHVQKVSGGGKLIASFGGAAHPKTLGPFSSGSVHGGHPIANGW